MSPVWEQLFNSLKRDDFRRIANQCTLSVADIEQEARLLCWQIILGQSTFDATYGSVQGYIMGRLWGLSHRYPSNTLSPRAIHSQEDEMSLNEELDHYMKRQDQFAEDPLRELIHGEEEQHLEQQERELNKILQTKLNDKDRNFLSLSLSLSIQQLSELFSLTPRAIRYRQQALIKRIHLVTDKHE